MNQTTVAHHLALLDLPPALDEASKSGRCTSPRTLHELSKLRDEQPEQVQSLLASGSEITRVTVSVTARSVLGSRGGWTSPVAIQQADR